MLDPVMKSFCIRTLYCSNSRHYKIPKISPGVYIFQRPFLRGLSTGGNLRFKTDWASLIVGSKFTVFALFYFVFDSNFPSTSPPGAYIWRYDLTEGFLRCRFGGLIHVETYFWNFTVSSVELNSFCCRKSEYCPPCGAMNFEDLPSKE